VWLLRSEVKVGEEIIEMSRDKKKKKKKSWRMMRMRTMRSS
jgi:hypothetical protein